jgi:ankyrin repeat protein
MSHLIFRLRSARTGIDQLLKDIGGAMTLNPGARMTVHTRDASNDTPLHYAAYWGDVRAIEILAAAGAEIDACGAYGATPLFNAVANSHYAAAARLLDLGASPHEESALGSAARAAAKSDDARIRALFCTAEANPRHFTPAR